MGGRTHHCLRHPNRKGSPLDLILFRYYDFFGWNMKSPVTHHRSSKPLGSSLKRWEWRARNYTICVQRLKFNPPNASFVFGHYVMSPGFSSAFLYLLTGFSNEHENKDDSGGRVDAGWWRNPGGSGCVVVDVVTGVQSARGLRIASLDWTCAMFSLLKLRTYVYLTGAIKSQSIALCHITTFHTVIVLTVHLCLPFFISPQAVLKSGVCGILLKREVISVRENTFVFLPNRHARPERRRGCEFDAIFTRKGRDRAQRQLIFKANKRHVVCAHFYFSLRQRFKVNMKCTLTFLTWRVIKWNRDIQWKQFKWFYLQLSPSQMKT